MGVHYPHSPPYKSKTGHAWVQKKKKQDFYFMFIYLPTDCRNGPGNIRDTTNKLSVTLRPYDTSKSQFNFLETLHEERT